MRFLRYQQNASEVRVGVLEGDDVVDVIEALETKGTLTAADRASLAEMVPLIEAGRRGLDLAANALELSRASGAGRRPLREVRLRAPLQPVLILASGGNYKDHQDEKDEAPLAGREPEFFFKTPRAVIGPGDGIELDPRVTGKLDYEVELAVVIGRKGRHIPVDSALDHVFGYTVLNDATARDRQVRTRPDGTYWYEAGASKNFDTSAPMGPVLVTRDEIPDPQKLKLRTHVNGELRQNNSTGNMVFSVAQLISFFSTSLTLWPGYVIATGTPGGTAWASDASLGGRPYERNDVVRATRYLAVGDEVACEVENIGVLTNPVVAPR